MDYSTVSVKKEMQQPIHGDSNPSTSNFDHEPSAMASKRPRINYDQGLGIVAMPLGFLQPHSSMHYVSQPPPPPVKVEAAGTEMEVECPEPLSMIVPARTSQCRQFWKAGDFELDHNNYACSSSSSSYSSVGMDHVRVHPKFLHSNATSHKWALGAVAELLDNSLDEVCNGATYVNVDMVKNEKDGSEMLLVEDNGGGMNPEKMRQCMSLGYSAKSKQANTIGQYGNGFKTSTMRLGADVIVFSRFPGKNSSRPTQTVGILSYSFLRGTGKEDIVVPMIDYEKVDQDWKPMARSNYSDIWNKNLEIITQWSPYSSEEDLLHQFDYVKDHGTRVVMYNLWEDDQGQLELDFEADPYDIQIRGVNRDEKSIQMAQKYPNSRHYLTYRHSLRSYASILYLRLPAHFRMILRGKDIEHHNIVNDMMMTKQMTYRPQLDGIFTKGSYVSVDVIVGFVKDAHFHIDVQGFNVYHKNRLIKPFWRVWNAAGSSGRGVIGVLEANFIEPAHDKQSFERTTILSRLEQRLIAMQKSYWSSNCHRVGYAGSAGRKDSKKNSKDQPLPPNNVNHCEKESKPTVEPPKESRFEERPTENGDNHYPKEIDLLKDVNIERETRKALEASLKEAHTTMADLDKSQINLIELLMEEREKSEWEHKRLSVKLSEANKTIDELREKVRELEALNGFSCKPEIQNLHD